jgi:hypothetical protein
MDERICGCTYDGPFQLKVCSPEHNAAAKNLNKAQALLTKAETDRDKWKRKAEEWERMANVYSLSYLGVAKQNYDLRAALEEEVVVIRTHPKGRCRCSAHKAFDLTPSRAEEIVSTMEAIIETAREVKHADAVIGAKLILQIKALDAFKKEIA